MWGSRSRSTANWNSNRPVCHSPCLARARSLRPGRRWYQSGSPTPSQHLRQWVPNRNPVWMRKQNNYIFLHGVSFLPGIRQPINRQDTPPSLHRITKIQPKLMPRIATVKPLKENRSIIAFASSLASSCRGRQRQVDQQVLRLHPEAALGSHSQAQVDRPSGEIRAHLRSVAEL